MHKPEIPKTKVRSTLNQFNPDSAISEKPQIKPRLAGNM
jgi:hypothetical protein